MTDAKLMDVVHASEQLLQMLARSLLLQLLILDDELKELAAKVATETSASAADKNKKPREPPPAGHADRMPPAECAASPLQEATYRPARASR